MAPDLLSSIFSDTLSLHLPRLPSIIPAVPPSSPSSLHYPHCPSTYPPSSPVAPDPPFTEEALRWLWLGGCFGVTSLETVGLGFLGLRL